MPEIPSPPLRGQKALDRLTNEPDPAAIAGTLGNASQACLVVSGLALGLILGARAVPALGGELEAPKMSSVSSHPDAAAPQVPADTASLPSPRTA